MRAILFIFCIALPILVSANNNTSRLEQLEKTLNEKKYQNIDDWYVICDRDKFVDTKKCSLRIKDLSVFLIDGTYSVYVGDNHFPRSDSAIKVDNNKTLNGREGHIFNTEEAMRQLKKGKVVLTRFNRWPYKANIDSEIDLSKFNLTLEEMIRKYNQL